MHKRQLILILLTFLIGNVFAQNVTIRGNAPTYAGDEFVFRAYSDLITKTEIILSSCQVDENGDFSVNFPISETTQTFVDMGAFRGLLFLESSMDYEIVLPRKHEKTEADKINPFFRQDEFFIGIKNHTKKELNYLISDFNLRYNIYMDKNYIRILQLGYKADIASQMATFDSVYADVKNPYFTKYKEYKYASLKHLAYVRNNEAMQKKFFGGKSVDYHNIAYMNLFNKIFSNFLVLYSKTEKGKEIPVDIIEKRSLETVKMTVRDWKILKNDSLVELVILKGLYDGLHSRAYPQQAVVELLDSVVAYSKIEQSKLIAKNIMNSSHFLLVGFPAPDFKLKDTKDKDISLVDLGERFVYLSFCNLKSYTCQQELEMLKIFHEKYEEFFDIVTISVDEDFEETKEFFKSHDYKWKLLTSNNEMKILKDYQIRAYPTYYLIGIDKKLKLAPAPSPNTDFEQRFGLIWQDYKNQEKRDEYKNK